MQALFDIIVNIENIKEAHFFQIEKLNIID